MHKFVLLLAVLIFLSACFETKEKIQKNEEDVVQACISLCIEAKNKGVDLSNGPCLSTNASNWKYTGWVCDVAHMPRQPVDNLKENQCPEYGKTAHNFVEVSPECKVIRVYKQG